MRLNETFRAYARSISRYAFGKLLFEPRKAGFKNKYQILFLFVLAAGVVLRLIPIITGNVYFGFDQGLDLILVKQLVADHKINLVSRYSGLQGVLMGPLWTWFLAVPFVLSGGHPASSALFLSFLSLVSSGFTYFFFKKLFGPLTALLAAAFTLLAPIFIFNSTVPASPHPLTFLFIFFLIFLYKIFVNKQSFFWVPLLLLTGIFFQFEVGFALFTLPVVFLLLIFFKGWQNLNRYFFLGMLVFILTFLPQAIFDLRHQYLISKGILNLFTGQTNSLYSVHNSLPVRFVERAWSFGDDFLTMVLLRREWFIILPAVIFMIGGWFIVWKNKLQPHLNFLLILLTIILTFYLGFSFYPGPLWVWYRAGLPIVYVLLFTIPLGVLWQRFGLSRFPIVALLLLIGLKVNIPNLSGDVANLKVQRQVLDYVYSSARGQPFSSFAYTPPVYDYIWQYDFWWYGQKKYGYLPKNWQIGIPLLGIGTQSKPPATDEGLFYLIIEPNRERPWEPDGWRQSYIRVGKILETKEFSGNVVVEKRTTQ